jgi:hypothetical protein
MRPDTGLTGPLTSFARTNLRILGIGVLNRVLCDDGWRRPLTYLSGGVHESRPLARGRVDSI